jgi:cbb3-type cytochrome oxidase maturation protein
MTDFFYLIPVALLLGAGGLVAFLWSLRSGQYEDLDGAAERILFDDDKPLKGTAEGHRSTQDQTTRFIPPPVPGDGCRDQVQAADRVQR